MDNKDLVVYLVPGSGRPFVRLHDLKVSSFRVNGSIGTFSADAIELLFKSATRPLGDPVKDECSKQECG